MPCTICLFARVIQILLIHKLLAMMLICVCYRVSTLLRMTLKKLFIVQYEGDRKQFKRNKKNMIDYLIISDYTSCDDFSNR